MDNKLEAMAEAAMTADRDHMVAEGAKLAWLIAQLACWPTRVDEEKTTNVRFLMMSAAATLRARPEAADEITRLNAENEELREVGHALAYALGKLIVATDSAENLRTHRQAGLDAMKQFEALITKASRNSGHG